MQADTILIQKTLESFSNYHDTIDIIRDAELDTSVEINVTILKDTIALYTALLDFLRGALKFFDDNPAMSGFRATFKQSHVQEKNGLLVAAMGQLETTLNLTSSTLALKKDQAEKNSKMLNDISPLTFKERHDGLRDLRVPETGKWVLENEQFERWIQSRKKKASVLWCYGIGYYIQIFAHKLC